MTPAAIICEAAADGVSLELSPAGTIKATGDQASVNRWLPVLRENKPALLEALAHPDPLPPLLRGLGGYAGPPGVPPLGDCELARQIRSMPQGDARLSAEDLDIKAGALWWRVAITESGGRTVEVDTPSRLNPRRLASLRRPLPRPWVRRDANRRASRASGIGQPR